MKITVNAKKTPKKTFYTDQISKHKFAANIQEKLKEDLKTRKVTSTPTLGLEEHETIIASQFDQKSSPNSLRRQYGRMAQQLSSHESVHWQVSQTRKEQLRLALLGLGQGSYSFDRYRKTPTKTLQELYLSGTNKSDQKWIDDAITLNEATNFCRDLVNTPAEDMGPDQFEAAAKKNIKGTGLKLKVMDEAQCKKAKMGSLLAVGRASHRKPRLLTLEWKGNSKSKNFLALCGKGICFDTGGLQIKPGGAMSLMRKDMGGAATVLATMQALAKLKAKTNIRAYIPLAENAIGPDAFRPGDILTASDGTTIETGHTDAEGRLVLADAIAQAKRDGAKNIVTVATLTGAAMVALGRIHVPIMGDKKLTTSLEKGAASSGEKVWTLPLDEDHKNLVRGKVADLTNSDGSGEAGCITAGAFLSHFAGDTPFAHCDISPGSWKVGAHDLGPTGATGVLVTTLVDAFRSWK